MASGALPPCFPPVEIDSEYYWDGALVSNTPLQYVVDYFPRRSRLIFQVDVFDASGQLPGNLDEVNERDKDIRYSSQRGSVRTPFATSTTYGTPSMSCTNCCRRTWQTPNKRGGCMSMAASLRWI